MMTKYAQNPAFKEAMVKIEEWAQMFSYDLHAGNWMFRLTPHGPQLVIIDPYK